MEEIAPRFTLESLASILGGEPEGPPGTPLDHPAAAGDSDPLGVAFAENEAYLKLAETGDIGAIIVGRDSRPSERALIRVDSPRQAFGMLLGMSFRELPLAKGIHPTAVVAPEAEIHPTAAVGAYCVVEAAKIGPGVRIYPFCYVGEGCSVAENATLYPQVVLYREVAVGSRTVIHSGSVLGADGFGYVWNGKRIKIPQVGRVEIGADVEIGANSTVDRATAGATKIGSGTKIDNLVQVAHNVFIGSDGVIAAQSGISGSTRIGDRVVMGGNVGTADHVNIGDDVSLGGRSSVDRDLMDPGAYLGTPSRPAAEAKRSLILYTKLPELLERIRTLEKRVQELER